MNPLKHIPNFITSLNILSGCLSIVASHEGYYLLASAFIFAAAIFDFMDGFSARLLHAYSELGKQLDSLADMVSFGVAPAFIAYNLIKSVLLIEEVTLDDLTLQNIFYLGSPFLIVVFSGLRLAKFNIDTRQTSSFIGLPTPANAFLWASLPVVMIVSGSMTYYFVILNLKFLMALIYIQSFLLVSPIPMFSFKFKNFKFKENLVRYIFLALVIIIGVTLKVVALPLVIFLYVIVSIINAIISRFFCKHSKEVV